MVNKRGRPTLYTEALADEILKRHAAGESLTKICDEPGIRPLIAAMSAA